MDEVRWDITGLVPNGWDEIYGTIEPDIEKYSEWKEKMSPDMSKELFEEYIRFGEDISSRMYRLYYHGYLQLSTDTSSPEGGLEKGKTMDLWNKWGDAGRPISHWLKGKEVEGMETLDDENAARLFAATPTMPDQEYGLHLSRESERFTLHQDVEQAISTKNNALGSLPSDLRAKIEAKQRYFFKPEGKKRGRWFDTRAELSKFYDSPDRREREAASIATAEAFAENLDLYFSIYEASVKDWNGVGVKLRGHEKPISVRNRRNEIPDEVVETLLETCTENRGIFHRWFRHKAELLGLDKLHGYDLWAPLDDKKPKEISYEEGLELVLETLAEFSPTFAEHARAIVDADHIDSHPRAGKRGGAFCATVGPDLPPYVLMNFNGTMDGVMTLAHELGHGIHSLYANHLSQSVQHAPITLAETASTLCEMIVWDKLFEKADDEERKTMLASKLTDAYGTILWQSYIVKFELAAHEAIQEGVTMESLSDIFHDVYSEMVGDSVEVGEKTRYSWAKIPHIQRTPFYCYGYSFGDLLTMSLYQMYKEDPEENLPKIERVLSAGGSENPVELLAEVGMDITSPDFWQNGFNMLSDMMDRLEDYTTSA